MLRAYGAASKHKLRERTMRRISHKYWLIPIVLAALAFGLAACATAPNQTSQTAGGTMEIHALSLTP
jgi:hypothetical protein